MGTDDGIEYSRGYGDQCLTCHSRDIGYVSSEGRRFCKNCRRIAALESQLADRDAEIERLKENASFWSRACRDAQATSDAALRAKMTADAEIERLRADLVWSVRKGVMVGHDECLRLYVWFDVHRGVEHDGTPESICRAVREARDGE